MPNRSDPEVLLADTSSNITFGKIVNILLL